jgi:hypothetical protein
MVVIEADQQDPATAAAATHIDRKLIALGLDVDDGCGLTLPLGLFDRGGRAFSGRATAGDVDFYSLILSELLDEVGIPKGFVKSIRISEGYENVFSGLLDLIADMEIDLSSDQVISLHKKNATEEYDEIRVIKEKDIKAFCATALRRSDQ